MKLKYLLLFILVLNLKNLTAITLLDVVKSAIESNNTYKVTQFLDEADIRKIEESEFKEALLLAAEKNNLEVFQLLEPYVKRTTHQKIYHQIADGRTKLAKQ